MTEFWEKWIQADDLRRIELVKTLAVDYPTLINSYLVDLYDTVIEQNAKKLNKTPKT